MHHQGSAINTSSSLVKETEELELFLGNPVALV